MIKEPQILSEEELKEVYFTDKRGYNYRFLSYTEKGLREVGCMTVGCSKKLFLNMKEENGEDVVVREPKGGHAGKCSSRKSRADKEAKGSHKAAAGRPVENKAIWKNISDDTFLVKKRERETTGDATYQDESREEESREEEIIEEENGENEDENEIEDGDEDEEENELEDGDGDDEQNEWRDQECGDLKEYYSLQNKKENKILLYLKNENKEQENEINNLKEENRRLKDQIKNISYYNSININEREKHIKQSSESSNQERRYNQLLFRYEQIVRDLREKGEKIRCLEKKVDHYEETYFAIIDDYKKEYDTEETERSNENDKNRIDFICSLKFLSENHEYVRLDENSGNLKTGVKYLLDVALCLLKIDFAHCLYVSYFPDKKCKKWYDNFCEHSENYKAIAGGFDSLRNATEENTNKFTDSHKCLMTSIKSHEEMISKITENNYISFEASEDENLMTNDEDSSPQNNISLSVFCLPPHENIKYFSSITEIYNERETVFTDCSLVKEDDDFVINLKKIQKLNQKSLYAWKNYKRLIQNYHMPPLEIRKTEKRGHSVFATSKIPKYAIIGEYTGVVKEDDGKQSDSCFKINNKYMIDADDYCGIVRFVSSINSSRTEKERKENGENPQNVKSMMFRNKQNLHVIYYALLNINEGDELYVNYNEGGNHYPTGNFDSK